MTKQPLPPLTPETEPLHQRIAFLEMMLRLLLCGIAGGEFDGDHRQECVNAILHEI